jgi:hypothetical protein
MDTVLIESKDGWLLPVRGWKVTRCFVDPGAFGMFVDGGTDDTLRRYLGGALTLSDGQVTEPFGGPSAKGN